MGVREGGEGKRQEGKKEREREGEEEGEERGRRGAHQQQSCHHRTEREEQNSKERNN